MIDLHVHSTASDGTYSPAALIDHALSHQVNILALTDHDTLYGIREAQEAAEAHRQDGHPIFVIPGIELSVVYKGRDIHILGLDIDPEAPTLISLVEESYAERIRRNERMAARFRENGIPITIEGLLDTDSGASVTRAHFARYLTQHGYTKDNNEAFDKYLAYGKPYFVPREYILPAMAIKAVTEAGGIPVLAHPLSYSFGQDELEPLLDMLSGCGLSGIEAYYSTYTSAEEEFLIQLAGRYGMYVTGGSDFHGSNKPGLEIGTGYGRLKVPSKVLKPFTEKNLSLERFLISLS